MDCPGENLLIKLWESIADKGIGSLLKPWQMRREGRATVDTRRAELLALAQAEVDAAAIRAGEKKLLPDGTLSNVSANIQEFLLMPSSQPLLLSHIDKIAENDSRAEAIRREISIAKAVIYAEEELAQDSQEPSETQVSEDWLLRWRDYAASVSSDELQSLWGKVLAGEIKTPGKFSLRTLEFLRNLSQDEASGIELLSSFVINNEFIFRENAILESNGVTFSLLLIMQDLGIVCGVESIGMEMTWSSPLQDKFEFALLSYGRLLLVRHTDAKIQLKLPIYKITSLGQQILKLGVFQANDRYLRALGETIKSQGFDIGIGSCVQISNAQITFSDLQPL